MANPARGPWSGRDPAWQVCAVLFLFIPVFLDLGAIGRYTAWGASATPGQFA